MATARTTAMVMKYGYVLMLTLIKFMERCHAGFGQTVCTLVLVHVWVGMYVSLLDIQCTIMIPSRVWQTRLLFNCNGNGIQTHGSALILILIECMKRCHVGFGRKVCTLLVLVLVHVCIWMFHCLIYNALLWHHRDCKLACYSTTTTMEHGYAVLLIMLECMERCHIGFGRTGSTLLMV